MFPPSTLTTAQILEVFVEETAAREGHVSDTFHQDQRLFARAILPRIDDVRPRDWVQGGVALKATVNSIWLYPYVFRQVCKNGAIIAKTLAAYSLGDLHNQEPEAVLQSVREGIATCCAPEVFPDIVGRMRSTSDVDANLALNLLPMLSTLSGSLPAELISQILRQFFRERDQTQFGLANAITAVARDTQDPDLRWNLEELGGAVAIGAFAGNPPGGEYAAAARTVAVG